MVSETNRVSLDVLSDERRGRPADLVEPLEVGLDLLAAGWGCR